MNIKLISKHGIEIALVHSDEVLITDVQSALDLIASVSFEAGTNRIILPKSAICEEFFDLKTRLAGEILQKFINYQTKVAIVGSFANYQSESLKDFIYESNKGKDLFFLSDEEQATDKLSNV
ncbi:DUF4180 domain-containing protein [Paenibacillus brevis]|uniref:DUF4180 domain-containing protein n=1 Tax=Paenibacillus brevis TaxID=2841508 RepID=A0ABS6FQG9_9BACL|nr:DUF4180 domain-containing protein [Paenibacillus brevis]MBU5672374.1 DUF4180 domain-containing protein [Paenibacillus brevis]